MTQGDLHALSGAYALDALDEPERARFRRHLAECPACAQEVRELRATAARLGEAVGQDPPAPLKDRVLAEVASTRQLPPSAKPEPGQRSRGGARVPRWALGLAAAAAVVGLALAGIFGGIALHRQDQLTAAERQVEQARQRYAPVAELLAAPDARTARGESGIGGSGTVVLSPSQNRLLFLAARLPQRPPNRDYQVWLMAPGEPPRSAGLLPADGIVLINGVEGARQVAVTVEPQGGSPGPTTNPFLVMFV
ncbi:anti-sigma factor [Amycolatopsis anabasis]|uniref:anti-sigma factor n=1 Tax=Amycolatopsis anabasis TaxID=1840409 RepID=UPI00131D0A71|nr:anti-sigma factor [Amycolatopsis anabasis]